MKISLHSPANDAISAPPVTQSDIISGFLAPYKTDIEKTPSRNLSLYIMEGLPFHRTYPNIPEEDLASASCFNDT